MSLMTSRAALCAGALVASAATPLAAQTFTDDAGREVTFYGQLNPAFQFFDDGEETFNNLVDNENSNSRLGFTIDTPLFGNDLRFRFETALGLAASDDFSQESEPDGLDWRRTNLRKLELIYSGDFGAVSAGQGSMATDGSAGADASRTTVVGSVAIPDVAGSFQFRDDAGALSGIEIGDVYDDFDGSRRMRLRYDTPSFSGFSLAAAYGQEVLRDGDDADYYDVAVYYENALGDLELEGSLGYAWKDETGGTEENIVGSATLFHTPTGLNLTVAGGADQNDGGSYGYVKAGYVANFFDFGYTAFAAEYYSGSDFNVDGSESEAWGFLVSQQVEAQSLEVYLGYRNYSYDDDAADYQDASSVLAGARWRF